jgi:glycerol-3-phosphate cytidylyltransferase
MAKKKRIMVDMSATILHHGHVRILKKAKKLGSVIVALTSDSEIKKFKKFESPFNFNNRKELLLSIKYVDEVIKSKWVITDNFLTRHNIDLLVHGNDNNNKVSNTKLKILKRTHGISSTLLRKSIKKNI